MSSKQQGLTLIELMVTLAAAIILIAVGMPLFSSIADNNRAVAQTNALVTALNLARSEAVGRGSPAAVCTHSAPLPAASPTCVTATPDFTNGWFVFVDGDGDGAVDAGESLRVWEELPAAATVTKDTVAPASVVFDAVGAANGMHTFEIGHNDAVGNKTRCITVTATGNIRTVRGACS